ncbi:MAG: epimerase [Thermoplasmata archaeon]|nr:epimerase [Thermoplasmata archaeon]MCI4355973.1 epimerase [Thermoplasmata archaeon]
MDVLLFGASGMVGGGVLRECLLSTDVRRAVSVGRAPTGKRSEKLEEIVISDLKDLSVLTDRIPEFDAAFFCVGVSSLGRTESEYSRLTYDLTLAVAEPLARRNPNMTFVYVSGAGTDSTERGRSMWARVKGRTENALLRLPFRNAFLFRPGAIQPLHGIHSKTRAYRVIYVVLRPLLPLLLRVAPGGVTTTERVGRAMIRVARDGAPSAIIDNREINILGR